MNDKITEGTITANTIQVDNLVKQVDNLVKIVTITEWNVLQSTLNLLQSQISTLVRSTQIANKEEEK